MTQEEKELVIRDLSARIPYDTWVQIKIYVEHRDRGNYLRTVATSDILLDGYTLDDYNSDIRSIKAYLRPMSSMTKDEEKQFQDVNLYELPYMVEGLDWLNAHHFDYRGLINDGLAIEAPEGMYNS